MSILISKNEDDYQKYPIEMLNGSSGRVCIAEVLSADNRIDQST